MPTDKILLLFEDDRMVGYTKDAPWAKDWREGNPRRATDEVARLDRCMVVAEKPTGNGAHGVTRHTLPKKTPAVAHRLALHFDGGCRPTNPGNRYGSFRLEFVPCALKKRVIFQNERIEFGHGTSSEAEFMALIAGLDHALKWLANLGRSPKAFDLRMVTDSTMVQGRISGVNVSRKTEPQQRMAALADEALKRCAEFGQHAIEWRGRAHNVKLFGH